MSEVSLAIGRRSYKVACAEGEEAHVTRLAEAIDAKLQAMPQLSPQDAQNLLFAALLLADDVHEARNAVTAAQDQAAQSAERADALDSELGPLREEIGGLRSETADSRAKAERLEAEAGAANETKQALARLEDELGDLRATERALREERDAARGEGEGLRTQFAALTDERDALRGELDTAQAAPPVSSPLGDPDLGPALERFAQLLESCADKLEGKAASA